uniref:Uncharacterized protein n=1 Tax=Tetranychus urticae TaxID=32264 RepID=T1KJL6_TETUR
MERKTWKTISLSLSYRITKTGINKDLLRISFRVGDVIVSKEIQMETIDMLNDSFNYIYW